MTPFLYAPWFSFSFNRELDIVVVVVLITPPIKFTSAKWLGQDEVQNGWFSFVALKNLRLPYWPSLNTLPRTCTVIDLCFRCRTVSKNSTDISQHPPAVNSIREQFPYQEKGFSREEKKCITGYTINNNESTSLASQHSLFQGVQPRYTETASRQDWGRVKCVRK